MSCSSDDWLDCGFTYVRNHFRDVFKKHTNFVRDYTSLLAAINLISLVVAGILELFVYFNAVECGNGGLNKAKMCVETTAVAVGILVVEVLLKCIEPKVFPLTKLFSLTSYIVGVIAYLIHFPEFNDKTCFESGYDHQPFTGNHPVASTMGQKPDRNKYFVMKECAFYTQHCVIQYLRAELKAQMFFCLTIWILSSFVSSVFMLQVCKLLPQETSKPAKAVTSQNTSNQTEHLTSNPQSGSQPQGPVAQLVPMTQAEVHPEPSDGFRKVTARIMELPRPLSSIMASPSSSSTGGAGERIELGAMATLETFLRKCSACGACQGSFEPATSTSDETSSGEERRRLPTFSPMPLLPQRILMYPKYCQNCGARFGNIPA